MNDNWLADSVIRWLIISLMYSRWYWWFSHTAKERVLTGKRRYYNQEAILIKQAYTTHLSLLVTQHFETKNLLKSLKLLHLKSILFRGKNQHRRRLQDNKHTLMTLIGVKL